MLCIMFFDKYWHCLESFKIAKTLSQTGSRKRPPSHLAFLNALATSLNAARLAAEIKKQSISPTKTLQWTANLSAASTRMRRSTSTNHTMTPLTTPPRLEMVSKEVAIMNALLKLLRRSFEQRSAVGWCRKGVMEAQDVQMMSSLLVQNGDDYCVHN